MRRELHMEFCRAVRGKLFWISLLIGLSISAAHFIRMVFPYRNSVYMWNYPLSAFAKWMGGESASVFPTLYYFTAPILAALPSAGSYKWDLESGYIKNIVLKTDRNHYLRAKFAAAFLTGGMVVLIPLCVNYILTAMVLPAVIPQSSTGYFTIFGYCMLGDLFYAHPYLYLLVYAGIDFVFFGLLATLALPAAHICDKLFSTVMAPFVLYLLIYAVTHLTNTHVLCPFAFLRPSQPIAANPIVIFVEAALMCIADGICYYYAGKADIR